MPATLMKYLSVFLVSMVKFFGGPVAGISLNLSFLETVLFSVAGMMASVVLFSIVGTAFNKWYLKKYHKQGKLLFTKRNRRIVKVWKMFGIGGIAFLTPVIFSPILGTILAVLFGVSRVKLILSMLWSSVFWGVVFTFFLSFLNNASLWDFFR